MSYCSRSECGSSCGSTWVKVHGVKGELCSGLVGGMVAHMAITEPWGTPT